MGRRRCGEKAGFPRGGNGILIDNHNARLMLDAEVIYTYESANNVNPLLAGRILTGLNANV